MFPQGPAVPVKAGQAASLYAGFFHQFGAAADFEPLDGLRLVWSAVVTPKRQLGGEERDEPELLDSSIPDVYALEFLPVGCRGEPSAADKHHWDALELHNCLQGSHNNCYADQYNERSDCWFEIFERRRSGAVSSLAPLLGAKQHSARCQPQGDTIPPAPVYERPKSQALTWSKLVQTCSKTYIYDHTCT